MGGDVSIFLLHIPAVTADLKMLVIPKGSKAVFWDNVGKGALQAGKDLGIRVTFRGPYTEEQYGAQLQIIEFGISQKYDAIVLAPNHVSKTAPALRKAVSAGIKVVLIDSDMDTHHHAALVESDNNQAGRMAALYMAALLKGEGEIVLARHLEGHASTHQREKGFLETFKLHYPRIEVVADPYVGSSLGDAYHTMSGLIDRLPSVDAIFSVGEEATLGTLKALKDLGLAGKIRFIGFDINATIGKAILDGDMDATIAQNPFMMGYQGVKTAFRLCRNETVPRKIFTETLMITADNYKTPKVQDLITTNIPQHDLY